MINKGATIKGINRRHKSKHINNYIKLEQSKHVRIKGGHYDNEF